MTTPRHPTPVHPVVPQRRCMAATAATATVMAIACACALLLAGCGQHAAPAVPEAAASGAALIHEGAAIVVPERSPLRQALALATAHETPFERPVVVPATIEADPARLVKVAPPVGGRVVRLYKGLGEAVRAGEPLAEIDSPDLAQAQADTAKAESTLKLAERAYARQQELATAEIAARKDVEQAESDREQALSEVRRARSRMAQLGAAGGRGDGRRYTLQSPMNGHVIDMTGAQGGFWNDTNAALLTVGDLSTVWLTASVPEKELASVTPGQTARITLNAYPGVTLTGPVAYVGQVLDADTRSVKARVVLANPDGRLRPGMFASATFRSAARPALTVPVGALLQNGLATRVWVERGPWRFESRTVQPGAQVGSEIEIVSGLAAGERVVAKGAVLLND